MATNITNIVPKSRSEYLERTEVKGDERIIINATEYITPDGIAERVKTEAERGQSVTFPLNNPGSVYNHGLGRYPSVMVAGYFNDELKEITMEITHIDKNSVRIDYEKWDNASGWVYIK